ncbi:peroxisomal membrane protein PAS20 [[Candida] railenensis]|uniref:Peroxisomal membrane protein PEX13 n=1 Tax=[Candida] railenensis TaxID=45579 RepID=A0A9P0W1R0_9ASCO|nr:peroxisomal membrane protein PAS20 [[Candida] railenensis]
MSVPRTKPWEVSSGTSAAAASGGTAVGGAEQHSLGVGSSSATAGGASGVTELPERPVGLGSDLSSMSNTSPYGASAGYGGLSSTGGYGSRYGNSMGGYGSSMYGSGGYGSSMYGSGGYGSSMYGGGYGSSMYGGGYGMSGGYGMGGYGSSMYGGMNGMNGGMGMNGGPGGIAEGTQATFQLIESIIGAVGGFAQMLEATYMATHSSFFTMVSLAEQFGNLKNALGSLLGIFALIKFAKRILYKLTGQTYNHGLSAAEFSKFEKTQKKLEENIRKQQSGKPARISFKPLLLFLAASIGFPYLLSKAIQKIAEQQRKKQEMLAAQGGGMPGIGGGASALDPANLQFAKALYEFNPENPNIEIELKPNELVAIISKLDPMGNESKWWKVRSRSGKMGYVPSNYLSIVERRPPQKTVEAPLPTSGMGTPLPASIPGGKSEDFSTEAFQKFQN